MQMYLSLSSPGVEDKSLGVELSSPGVEGSSPAVEGLFPAVECLTPGVGRNPDGACLVLAVMIPVQGQGDLQRTALLINFLDIMDSRGEQIADGPVKSAPGWGFDKRSHGKWVCCLIDHS